MLHQWLGIWRQTAEFIERPVCQRRGARLYLSSFINSGCCPGHVPSLTSKNKPCEVESSASASTLLILVLDILFLGDLRDRFSPERHLNSGGPRDRGAAGRMPVSLRGECLLHSRDSLCKIVLSLRESVRAHGAQQ